MLSPEGHDMFFIDGEIWPPSLHGTGTEDYFCGAWNEEHLKSTVYHHAHELHKKRYVSSERDGRR